MEKFDLMVIGSGSGLEVSAEASDRGMSVAVVEEGPFGGTCLNRGCIPSKMLIHCADVVETVNKAHLFGIEAHLGKIDWNFIIKRTYQEIDQDAKAIEEGNRNSSNITVFKGSGRFVADKTLEVNGQQITAETILIAAGTRPWAPSIPGLDKTPYITSDQALRLPQQPKRLAIVGGGYIAAELAHFFGSLGTEVTLIHRRSTMLREEDEDIARRFTEVYQRRFNLLLDSQVSEVRSQGGEISVKVSVQNEGQQHAVEIGVDTLLLATGRVPNTDFDQALRLPQQPKRLAIVGGGYIAAELAHFFGSLGTEVTLIHRRSTMLREEDEDIARRFTEVYQRRFNLLLDSQVSEVRSQGGEISVKVSVQNEGQQHAVEIGVDTLLLATGRVPNTDLLEVANTGVDVDDRGYIKTDRYLETNVPGIWALGDIVGKYLLKHSANLEASYAANNIFHSSHKEPVDYRAMPHAIFASPQVASVGLTEELATRMDIEYVTSTYNYSDTAYGSSIEDRDGFVKVLAHPETREILGCHIIGAEASILIQEAANAMRLGLPTTAITQSIYVHPALPEVVQRAFAQLPV